jgi:phage portal protein BeeE
MTAFEFRQLMQTDLDLRGNALAIKEFNGRGRVTALWPVCWTRVEVLSTVDQRSCSIESETKTAKLSTRFRKPKVVCICAECRSMA